jgi:DNA replicative helicase MCM subunit Mcm2 (Cdc46/Mcm family)
MWYFKPKQYLQDSFTRSGLGVFLMGKNSQNKSQVMPVASNSAYSSVQTSATGSSFVSLASAIAGSATFINNTGTTINVSKDGGTTFMQIPTGASFCVDFIQNTNQVSVKRADNSNTQVTIYYQYTI